MSRNQSIRRAILDILERAEPYALPEATLHVSLNARLRPPVGQAEFDDALLWLRGKGSIRVLPDDLDEEVTKWLITEAGKTFLRK